MSGPGWPPPSPPLSPPPPPPAPPAPAGWPPPPPPPPSRNWLLVGLAVGLAVVLLAGGVGLVAARGQRLRRARDLPPRARVDHWHAAYGVYLCDRYLAAVEGDRDRSGIHSHGDGIVHVEPLGPASAGRNAVFRRFEEAQQVRVSASSLQWVDGVAPVEVAVADGCQGREAEIVTFVDGLRLASPPGGVRLRDGQVIVVALVPTGTSYAEIGPPPSEADLPRVRGLTP